MTRELGFDEMGAVVHRHPGGPTRAEHGVFDLGSVTLPDTTDMQLGVFDRLWCAQP